MNYLIQRGKIRNQVINVPDGLPELLSDITREVLRCQPTKECMCQFIIDYLHSVIVTHEKARVAKNIIDRALRTVDEIISDMCICDITKMKGDEMALAMEECFRRFMEKRRCEIHKDNELVQFHEEDMLDELIKRCKFTEHELKTSRPLIEEAYNRFVQAYLSAVENTDGTEALYQYFREREEKRKQLKLRTDAATRIQSTFRGYLVRRSMLSEKKPQRTFSPEDLQKMEEAACTIQRCYRKYQLSTRKSDTIPNAFGNLKEEPEEICEPVSVISMDPTPKAQLTTEESPKETAATIEASAEQIEETPAEVSVRPENMDIPEITVSPVPEEVEAVTEQVQSPKEVEVEVGTVEEEDAVPTQPQQMATDDGGIEPIVEAQTLAESPAGNEDAAAE